MPRVYASKVTTTPLKPLEEPDHEALRRSYAVPRIADISRAVEDARIRSEIAAAAYQLVKEQAVYALRMRGRSMRDVQDETGIPKSDAGRLTKAMENDLGELVDGHLAEPANLISSIARTTEDIWGGGRG